MRTTTITMAGAILALALVATGTADAQTHRAHIGPRIGYNFDADAVTLGGQLSLPIGRHLEFYPSADVHLVDEGSAFGVNFDLKYRLPARTAQWLYVGGGLGVLSRSINDHDHTDTGLNLMMGAESLRGRVHPFVEGRVFLSDGSTAQLLGGLNFTL